MAERPNAKFISTTLSDAIAFQLFNYRRDRNHTLVFVTMTFQFLIHVGSVATICAFTTSGEKPTISDLLKIDVIFLLLLILMLLGKLASGSHSGRSRDMVALGLLLCVEIIPCLVDPSISIHDNVMCKFLLLALFVHTASALRLLTRTERFYNLERLVSKALPTILLIVLHTFVWMIVFSIIGMRLFGGQVWNQSVLVSYNITADWCTTSETKLCTSHDETYNFNTMTSSLISLYVASQKPFIFSNVFYELCGSTSYIFFVLYWLIVPIANLLVLKAVLFQRYWTEMKLLENLKVWCKEKEQIYLKNLKKKRKDIGGDVTESSHVSQFVTRVKSFGSVIHQEFLSERYCFFFIHF